MSSIPPFPVVPPPDDDGARLLGDDVREPLDPDLNENSINSADADERRATEGELDGTDDEA